MAILAMIALAIWLGLAFGWHRFWRADQRLPLTPDAPSRWPAVTAVIPARNEEDTIVPLLTCLAAQDYAGPFHAIVVNDSSTDRTAARAREVAQQLRSDLGIRVIDAPPLEPGWAGKMWALDHGARAAEALKPDYLWFVDADTAHGPAVLRRLVAQGENKRLALVSEMVRLATDGFWEKLLVPAFIFFFQLLYPFPAINRPASRIAGAAGGSLMIRRDALHAIGGIAGVRAAVIDDCAIGWAVKRTGRRIWLGLAQDSRSVRRYEHLGDFWAMVARSAYVQLRHSPVLLIFTLAGLGLTFVVPVLAMVVSGGAGVAPTGLATWLIMTAIYLPTVKYHYLPPAWALSLPLAAVLFGAMTVSSAIDHCRGRGVRWRGRENPHPG